MVSRGLIKSLELVNYFEKPKSMEDTETKLVFKVEIIDLRKWSKYWFNMICFFVKTIDLFNSHLWVLGRGRKKRGERERERERKLKRVRSFLLVWNQWSMALIELTLIGCCFSFPSNSWLTEELKVSGNKKIRFSKIDYIKTFLNL